MARLLSIGSLAGVLTAIAVLAGVPALASLPPAKAITTVQTQSVPAAPKAVVVTQRKSKAKPAAPVLVSTFDQEAKMSPAQLVNRWNPDIARASIRFKVPQKWIRSVMEAESGGRTMSSKTRPITSSMGAMGLMQLMPGTYHDMRGAYRLGPNPYEPHDNIIAAAAYLHDLYRQYGYPAMFAAYNDGPGNLEQRLVDGRVLPLETQRYVSEVTGQGSLRIYGGRGLVKFTRPNGESVMINGFAVASVRAPLPGEYAPDVRAVISVGKMHQGVTQTVAQATAALRAHGSRG